MKFRLINDPWYQFRSPIIEGGRAYVVHANPTELDFTVAFLSPNSKKIEMALRHDVMRGQIICTRLSIGGQSWPLPVGGITDTAEIGGHNLRATVEMALADLVRAEERIDPTGARTEERAQAARNELADRDKDTEAHWAAARKQAIESALAEK